MILFLSGLIAKIKLSFASKYAKSLARHLATLLAGALASIGVVVQDSAQLELIISGVLIYIVTQGLSFLDKKDK